MWNMVIMFSSPMISLRTAEPPDVVRKTTLTGLLLTFASHVPLSDFRRSNVSRASNCAKAVTVVNRNATAAAKRSDFMVKRLLKNEICLSARRVSPLFYSTLRCFPLDLRCGARCVRRRTEDLEAAISFAYSASTKAFKLLRLLDQKLRYCSSQESTAFSGSGLRWEKRLRPSRCSLTRCARRSRRRCFEIAGREIGNSWAICPAG